MVTGLFSQSIISYRQDYSEIGKHASGNVLGYETHFMQADSCKITFTSSTDTICFWVKNAISNTYMHVKSPGLLNTVTWYKLSVENSIDGILHLPYAFTVLDTSFYRSNGYPRPIGRFEANSNSEVRVQTLNIKSIANVYNTAFYIQSGVGSFAVDSIIDMVDYEVSVNAFIPANAKPGSYDLFIYKNQDTMLICRDALFLSNSLETQIDSVSPDSIHNNKFIPWTIYVHGNKTHFTNDSNIIFNEEFSIGWGGFIDSIQIINDTLLKFNIALPIPVKQVINPNSMLYIYNPTDGLLAYPMVVLYYGSIGGQLNNYESVKLYPNPVQDQFWIESDEFIDDQIIITVFNVNGAEVGEYRFNNEKRIQLHARDLAAGVYFVYVQGSEKQKVLKFIRP